MTVSQSWNTDGRRELKYISTHWTTLTNPSRFVLRYGAAVRSYLRALLPAKDDADEVEQEFLLRVVAQGFPTTAPGRGHFRHYLIAVVRNAAYTHLRKRNRRPATVGDLDEIPAGDSSEQQWRQWWRQCVLQNTWNALREHQKKNRGNLFHAVLKATVEHHQEDSTALAERVSQATGQKLSPAAFRKQLSRARNRFAELLVEEVASTITNVTNELLEEELRELDLLKYVQDRCP